MSRIGLRQELEFSRDIFHIRVCGLRYDLRVSIRWRGVSVCKYGLA